MNTTEFFMNEKMLEEDKRAALQNQMWLELEAVIEKLKEKEKINLVEYVIARDVLWDCTLGHEYICESDNIAQDFIYYPNMFAERLHNGYLQMKKNHPDIDTWDFDKINEISANYLECAYL